MGRNYRDLCIPQVVLMSVAEWAGTLPKLFGFFTNLKGNRVVLTI